MFYIEILFVIGYFCYRTNLFRYFTTAITIQANRCLKMLCLYLLGHTCLYLTLLPYLSSETYSRKYEKLPKIVIHAFKIITEK